jgi:hypothetical protein
MISFSVFLVGLIELLKAAWICPKERDYFLISNRVAK